MTLHWPLDNSYARLPGRFFARVAPTPVASPRGIALNRALAAELGLDAEALAGPEGAAVLAGNVLPGGAEPIAQAYAGHQFGVFVPALGDGRAILLGEVVDGQGRRRDIQLKGAGPTPWSRRGDGRAALGPVIREYLVSEAMAALGVPTTRALAAVATGETVWRDGPLPGAVLVRVASSHIRVGTFEYFAATGDLEGLRCLADHVIGRHFPAAAGPAGLIAAAAAAQARLVAAWMAAGFVHGVMNTDNAHVGGDTIDYGPCAFLDAYDPQAVFSSIDHGGRYAYANQPRIALWNMARLATALLPILEGSREPAIEQARAALAGFLPCYEAEWLARFRAKLGLATAEEGDGALIADLLAGMARGGADFTRTFRGLAGGSARGEFAEPAAFDAWAGEWRARLAREGASPATAEARMAAANPALIPRNHRVEQAIAAAVGGDLAPFHRLATALSRPFADDPATAELAAGPAADERVRHTFCGT